MAFPEILRRLRRERGITQGELADRAGVNRSYLSLVENGKSSPTIDVVERLASGLGCGVWTLLTGVEEPHFEYDTGDVKGLYDGLKEFLADEDEMLLIQPTAEEVTLLRGIRCSGGFQPDKRFFRDALLAMRRRSRSSS